MTPFEILAQDHKEQVDNMSLISGMMSKGYEAASQGIKEVANINNQIMTSALDYKKTQIDEWYKQQQIQNAHDLLDYHYKALALSEQDRQDRIKEKNDAADEMLQLKRDALESKDLQFAITNTRLNLSHADSSYGAEENLLNSKLTNLINTESKYRESGGLMSTIINGESSPQAMTDLHKQMFDFKSQLDKITEKRSKIREQDETFRDITAQLAGGAIGKDQAKELIAKYVSPMDFSDRSKKEQDTKPIGVSTSLFGPPENTNININRPGDAGSEPMYKSGDFGPEKPKQQGFDFQSASTILERDWSNTKDKSSLQASTYRFWNGTDKYGKQIVSDEARDTAKQIQDEELFQYFRNLSMSSVGGLPKDEIKTSNSDTKDISQDYYKYGGSKKRFDDLKYAFNSGLSDLNNAKTPVSGIPLEGSAKAKAIDDLAKSLIYKQAQRDDVDSHGNKIVKDLYNALNNDGTIPTKPTTFYKTQDQINSELKDIETKKIQEKDSQALKLVDNVFSGSGDEKLSKIKNALNKVSPEEFGYKEKKKSVWEALAGGASEVDDYHNTLKEWDTYKTDANSFHSEKVNNLLDTKNFDEIRRILYKHYLKGK